MLAIKDIGVITAAGFLTEVGNMRCFKSPRQIQKLAGISLNEKDSEKHKGQTDIGKRDQSKLREVLLDVEILLIAGKLKFWILHEYYIIGANNSRLSLDVS